MQNSIDKFSGDFVRLMKGYYRFRLQLLSTLSFFDRLWFERYLSLIIKSSRSRLLSLNDKRLRYLIFKKYGCFSDPNVSKVVLNLSSVEISNLELTILIYGLDQSIPSRSIKQEEVYSKFEVLFAQLGRLRPVSADGVSDLKKRLNDLAHAYARSPVSSWESDWRSERFRTLKSLCNNNSIVITWSDKGSWVEILDLC